MKLALLEFVKLMYKKCTVMSSVNFVKSDTHAVQAGLNPFPVLVNLLKKLSMCLNSGGGVNCHGGVMGRRRGDRARGL